jgi:NAD(P)-dependent dehydrogenase (short-subunit alcohol dehydrogenase family)
MIEDKVVVVTGAASGLGRATALKLADLGATVIVCDLGAQPHGKETDVTPVEEAAEAVRERGSEAMVSFGDVTDEDYVAGMVEDVYDEYGRIDGAINYAGFLRDDMSFNMPLENWKAVLDVHLTGQFLLLKHLGDHWREQYKADNIDTQRSFLAVSSASARGSASQINYSAAKAGVLGLTRTGARDLHRYDVRVNAMMPAAFTRMLDANVPEDVLEDLPKDALGPEKVAPLPAALMADSAEDITGWTFAIAGDTVHTVTDPKFDGTDTMEGGWTAEALSETLDDLVANQPRSKTDPGGLLGEVLE